MRMLHTMLRVGNLQRSIDFYTKVLGMELLRTTDRPEQKYSLAFVGYDNEERTAVLELTYNYGVDRYDLGSAYGHIAIGVPDVKGVWLTVSGGSRLMMVVSIKQRYPGHAKQAAIVASQCHAGAYLGRFVVVVDDDIDPSNTDDVIWAMSTRCEPEQDIDILRRCWSGPLDPVIHPTKKGFNSRAIIDATRPYEWMKDFPPVAESSKEVLDATTKKWGAELFGSNGKK